MIDLQVLKAFKIKYIENDKKDQDRVNNLKHRSCRLRACFAPRLHEPTYLEIKKLTLVIEKTNLTHLNLYGTHVKHLISYRKKWKKLPLEESRLLFLTGDLHK